MGACPPRRQLDILDAVIAFGGVTGHGYAGSSSAM